jgi:phosphate transport system permease protein
LKDLDDSINKAPAKIELREAEMLPHYADNNLAMRQLKSKIFTVVISLATLIAIALLGWLLLRISFQALPWLSMDFITSFPSRMPSRAGVKSALVGSAVVITIAGFVSVLLGVGAAVYLEELASPKHRLAKIIEVAIANLAGVPSLVYGILGLALFVRTMNMGRSLMAAGCTLALMILPIIILTSREALRTVPISIRQAAYALGASPWQTVSSHVLPQALPQILTGVILALSRGLGEAAPLIIVGGVTYIAYLPESLFDPFTTLPIQVYNWAGRPQEDFQGIAAAGIIVLLALVIFTNLTAIFIRARYDQKRT